MISPSLVAAVALAVSPITLEQVREESRRNTPARVAELQAEQAGARSTVARSSIFPQLQLSANVGQRYLGPQRFYQPVRQLDGTFVQEVIETPESSQGNFDLQLSVSQLLFDGGRWWTEIGRAGASEDAARGQLAEQQLTSEYEGMRRFYELLRAQRAVDVLEAAAKRSADQFDRARALFEAGRLQKADAIAAEVNLGNDRISVLRQKSRLAAAQADLAIWLARDGAEELTPVEPKVFGDKPSSAPTYDVALKAAQEGRPVLKALESQARAASLAASAAAGNYWPRISLQGSYGRSAPTAGFFFAAPGLQNAFFGGVNLNWDLFNGLATSGTVRDLQHAHAIAELNFEQGQRELHGDVMRSIRALEAALATVDVATQNREAAGKGLLLAEERFKAGAGSTLEVRDAQLKLTQSELAVLESRIDVEIARANLERVMGSLGTGAGR